MQTRYLGAELMKGRLAALPAMGRIIIIIIIETTTTIIIITVPAGHGKEE